MLRSKKKKSFHNSGMNIILYLQIPLACLFKKKKKGSKSQTQGTPQPFTKWKDPRVWGGRNSFMGRK